MVGQAGADPSDEALLEQVHVPRDVRENPAALKLLMPVLRADTRLYRRYVYQPREPLPVPVFAYGGIDDANVRPTLSPK